MKSKQQTSLSTYHVSVLGEALGIQRWIRYGPCLPWASQTWDLGNDHDKRRVDVTEKMDWWPLVAGGEAFQRRHCKGFARRMGIQCCGKRWITCTQALINPFEPGPHLNWDQLHKHHFLPPAQWHQGKFPFDLPPDQLLFFYSSKMLNLGCLTNFEIVTILYHVV